MTKRYKLLTLVLLVNLLGCKHDDILPCQLEDVQTPYVLTCKTTKDIDTIRMYIHGKWTWLQEKRQQRGQPTEYLTPKTEGYSLEFKLQNDTATFYKCNTVDAVYRFRIVRLKEISGTYFPEDEDPVLAYYDLTTGLRFHHVPILICSDMLVLQHQFVSSFAGEEIWKLQN